MATENSHAEALAAIHVVTALLSILRRNGLLSTDDINHLLSQAEWPLERSEEPGADEAARLISHIRARVHSA